MGYRMTYLRIISQGYVCGWQSDAAKAAFKEKSRRLFQESGWELTTGRNGVCDTVTKGPQDLYLHPASFSGVVDEANVQFLRELLSKAQTFRCNAVDFYEEYFNLSDDEYRTALESKRDEITDFILRQCRTKSTRLYIAEPVAAHVAQHFEICRLCDKGRKNAVANHFASELIAQLVEQGRMVIADTTVGPGIRTATEKELQAIRQPAEQIDGQMTMLL